MSIFKTNWQADETGHISVHNAIANALNGLNYNIKWAGFGAVGDGVTDDTAAIQAAHDAIPETGGVLFFPPGAYKVTASITIDRPCIVQGCGMAGHDGLTGAVSKIVCASQTVTPFDVSAYRSEFRDIAIINTAVSAPTEGAGIKVYRATYYNKVDFHNVSVYGFFNGIDIQTWDNSTIDNVVVVNPINYGIKVANVEQPDSGDWSLVNTLVSSNTNNLATPVAGVRVESSGGGKIGTLKVVAGGGASLFTHCIDMTLAGSSVIFQVENSSLEGGSVSGINIVCNDPQTYKSIAIIGNQIAIRVANETSHAIQISTDDINNINGVTIVGNNFDGSCTGSAIELTAVNNVQVFANTIRTFTSLLTQTDCTNVVVQAA